MRRGVLVGTLITVAVVGAIGAVTACAAGTRGVSTNVGVVEREWTIRLSRSHVPAGTVVFHVKNAGHGSHDFVVLKTKLTPMQLIDNGKRLRPREPGLVGRTRILKPGTTADLKLTLKPGHYLLLCSLVGHLKAGQHTKLTVG
jgi:uncharacterized cupredoxin-like copper-binding protein